MIYHTWEPRTADRSAAVALAKALALNEIDCILENSPEEPPQAEIDRALSEKVKDYSLVAGVLCARGMTDAETAADFVAGNAPLSDPMLLRDMDKACARIRAAVENEETIVVFGDYDVDGVTATALLFDHLR
jgi:single-stranded-DNA-specific exonuclease